MDKKIILNKYKYVDAENKNVSNRLSLQNDKKIIREDQFDEEINEYNVYLDERESCNTIRLSAQINLMASNSVFNSVTEIVKNEDSDECICLNFATGVTISSAYGKPSLDWGSNMDDCIQDTQITYDGDSEKNYTYHCGIDIFDNHVLRSKTSIPNYYLNGVSQTNFNTISDYLVDGDGQELISTAYYVKYNSEWEKVGTRNPNNQYMHIYNKNNILSFTDCLGSKLIDKNGWLGFINKSKMDSYDTNGNNFGISRVINNKPVSSFIEMYPGKSHYSLLPYYNKKRHRQEKNWEYCLTYPSDSTIENIPFINKNLKTLKIAFIDESEIDDDGLLKTVIYSISKHGLKADDIINIYKSTYDNSKSELFERNVIVDSVIDDYTFTVYLEDYICKNWVSVFDNEQIETLFSTHDGTLKYYPKQQNAPKYVTSFNNYINADFDDDEIGAQNLSFARVNDSKQVEYYVRIFSRFPNFDFMDLEPTEENIYGKFNGTKRNIDEYSRLEYEKQSTLSKLGFAKNVYGDDMAQIVYNDDINISNIKDNLGRPLTSLYLSFFKTNYGRKEWYNGDVKNKNVEHSHCFGKLNSGFDFSPHLSDEKFYYGNTRLMNNVDTIIGVSSSGLTQLNLRQALEWLDDDEINYKDQDKFYGDLCEYSKATCDERVIQPIMHRFNTQQRELSGTNLKMKASFSSVKYHDILRDDTTPNYNFTVTEGVFDNSVTSKRSGCVYISNYEIPIRTFSETLSVFKPQSYLIDTMEIDKNKTYTATTNVSNYLNHDTLLNLYDKSSGKSYRCDIVNILAHNTLSFNLYDANNSLVSLDTKNAYNYILYKRPVGVPSYANLIGDGIGEYRWRNVIQNGFETTDGIIEEYPFTNNCLYVNKQINIFVRRQDPFGELGITKLTGFSTIDGKQSPIEANDDNSNSDDSINEKNSIC